MVLVSFYKEFFQPSYHLENFILISFQYVTLFLPKILITELNRE